MVLLLPLRTRLLSSPVLLRMIAHAEPTAGAEAGAVTAAAASPCWPLADGGKGMQMFRVTSGQRRRTMAEFSSSPMWKPTLARHRTCCPVRSTHCGVLSWGNEEKLCERQGKQSTQIE